MPEVPPSPVSRRARLWEWADERRVPLMAILITIALAVAVYLLGQVVYKLREILLLVVVAGFVALLLNPVVLLLDHTVVKRRGSAVAIVTAVALVAFIGLAYAFGNPLAHALGNLIHNLPGYVKSAEKGRGPLGGLVRKYHLQHWVQQNLPKLEHFATNLSKPALTVGKGALNLVIALFAIFILVVLMLLEGPKVSNGLLRMMAPQRGERVSRIAAEVHRSVTGYMLGNFITSIIAGVVVFVTLTIVGVPYALLWSLWVALVDFLPMIGGALAGIPTVIFAFIAGHGFTAGIVTLIVFLAYTQIENHILNPVVMSRTVKMNPLLVLIAVLVGANIGDLVGGFFGGFVGTLLAIPVAGSIQVIVREAWQSTAPESQLEVVGGSQPSAVT